MKLLFTVASLIFGLSVAQAEILSDSALNRLVRVERFSFGGTGEAGVISQGEKDYREILSRSTALNDFKKLFQIGNAQAKCYALVGIHALKPAIVETLSSSLRSEKTEVATQSGCIIMQEPINAILKAIEAGAYPPASKEKK